jgi:acetyltransferase-like isoleucine patch superfamily enzyme
LKTRLKLAAQTVAAIVVAPLTILHAIAYPTLGDSLFAACSQFLSLLPGKTGSYLRIGFYRFAMQRCSKDCFIGFGTLFSQRDTIIEVGVYIGPQCNIGACHIGRDTLVASGVHIMSGTEQHRFAMLDTPIRDQGGVLKPVSIGNDCWLGNGALIMADVGAQCVVGAGAVVSRALEPLTVAAGNPARPIRMRGARQMPGDHCAGPGVGSTTPRAD